VPSLGQQKILDFCVAYFYYALTVRLSHPRAPYSILHALLCFAVVGGGVFCATSARAVLLLVADESASNPGTSISTLDTATGVRGIFFTGTNHTDGLAYATDGFLYATSFGDGTVNRITSATTFTTVASGLNHPGAMTADKAGNLYVPNFGVSGTPGTTLTKLTPNGSGGFNATTLASNLNTPDGVVFDSHGVLYEADYGSNSINTINTTTGAVTTFVSNVGLASPSDLTIDSSDNLYVANFANGTVSKITPAKVVTNNYGTGLTGPFGLYIDPGTGTLFGTSWQGTNANRLSSFPAGGGAATNIDLSGPAFNGPTHLVTLQTPEPSGALLLVVSCMALAMRRRREKEARLLPNPSAW
jgi:hypothetical protein